VTLPLTFLGVRLGGGGAEKILADLTKLFSQNYPRVILFQRQESEYEHAAVVSSLNLSVFHQEFSRTRRALSFSTGFARLKLERWRSPEGTWLSFSTLPNLLNVLTKRRGSRAVITVHSPESRDLKGVAQALSPLVSATYRRADHAVAVSHGVAADLIENFKLRPERVSVIHNGVEVGNIQLQAREPLDAALSSLFTNRPCLTYTARLAHPKKHELLLHSMAALKADPHLHGLGGSPPPRLLFLGSGPRATQLATLGRSLGLAIATYLDKDWKRLLPNCDVAMLGHLPNPFPLLSKSAAFVFPSYSEGFGIAIVEALSCGLPTIASDCPYGPREILAPGTGHAPRQDGVTALSCGALITCHGPEAGPTEIHDWARTIARFSSSPGLREELGKAARRRAQDFELQKRLLAWTEVLIPQPPK